MDRKIKTALCSFGMSGKVFHAPLLSSHPGFELAAVVERSKDEARKIYPAVRIFRSINDILHDNTIELVVVNTPDNTHYQYAKQALEAGKNVVVEKPFTLRSKDAYSLVKLADQKKLMLTVFQNRRWDSDFLTVKKVVEENLLGRLVEFESHFDRYRNFIQSNTWKEKPGTGTLYNLGSHMIDQALILFGKPEAVMADIRALRTGSEVDDSYQLWLYYPGIRVTLKASYLVREPGPRYILNGTLGSFLKYGIDPQEEALKNGFLPGNPDWGTEPEENWGLLNTEFNNKPIYKKLESLHGNYPGFYDNIYNYLVRGIPLAMHPEESALVIRVIEAAFRSHRLRKAISII
jgi:scyllo-inositol 2-dehydrogenase (NADP+)